MHSAQTRPPSVRQARRCGVGGDMRPVIGVSNNFGMNADPAPRPQTYLLADYSDGVFAAGGIALPLPVPPRYDDALLDEILDCCDGVIFSGGYDLDPQHYGEALHPRTQPLHERRDRFEVDLFRRADARRMPILGICLGHQAAHVARGGALVQHVDELGLAPSIVHYLPNEQIAFHEVGIEADSRLAGVMGASRVEVSSRHHQVVAAGRLGAGLRTAATADDGVIEASEDCDGRFLVTVQWHPEDLLDRPEHLALFEALVEEARAAAYRRSPNSR